MARRNSQEVQWPSIFPDVQVIRSWVYKGSPPKYIDYGVYGENITIYPKLYSICLRGTIGLIGKRGSRFQGLGPGLVFSILHVIRADTLQPLAALAASGAASQDPQWLLQLGLRSC